MKKLIAQLLEHPASKLANWCWKIRWNDRAYKRRIANNNRFNTDTP